MVASPRFSRISWIFVAYLIFVILFGAWVRISHSGAGCGSNWPDCNGEILPTAPSTKTLIEFTHRLTSGLCGLFGIAMLAWAWRLFGRGPVTIAAALTLLFIIFEGAIGAGLVLGELVEDDDSLARAIVISLHLANTLLLTASATLMACWSRSASPGVVFGPRKRAFAIGMTLIVVTAMSGAITALGDTLFPSELTFRPGVLADIRDELTAASHFLVRLRVFHPLIALATAGYLLWLLVPQVEDNKWAKAAMHCVALEVLLGFLNIALAAPGWLQILHLLTANILWVAIVLAAGAHRGLKSVTQSA